MTLDRILELVDLLPPDAPYPVQTPRTLFNIHYTSNRAIEHNRRVAARTDPRFAWKFVMCFVRLGRYLPDLVTEQFLWRTYRYEACRADDPVLAEAMDLDQPRMHFLRNVVQGCLILPEVTFEQISEKTGISAAALRLYEQLFFNVRDRIDDAPYIASLVHPDHRTAELNPNYGRLTESGQYLLRLAYHYGLEPMLELAGMIKSGGEQTANELAKRLETTMMNNAVRLSQMGLLNQHHVPGIMHARNIITATKQSGQDQSDDDNLIGLQALSFGEAVMRTLKGIQGPEQAQRRQLRAGIAAKGTPTEK